MYCVHGVWELVVKAKIFLSKLLLIARRGLFFADVNVLYQQSYRWFRQIFFLCISYNGYVFQTFIPITPLLFPENYFIFMFIYLVGKQNKCMLVRNGPKFLKKRCWYCLYCIVNDMIQSRINHLGSEQINIIFRYLK